MRVLITGITGYIGSHLAQAFLPDCEVYGLVREPLNLTYLGDIRDQVCLLPYDGTYESIMAALEAAHPDLVYHLAAYYTGGRGEKHTPALIASNIAIGACLLDAMADHTCGVLVYASTVMTHYRGKDYCPLNLYAATKRAFTERETVELLCRLNSLTLNAAWGERPRPEREIRRVVRLYPLVPGWEPKVPLEEGLQGAFLSETASSTFL